MNFEQFISYNIGMLLGFSFFIYLVNTGKMDNICDWLDNLFTEKKD